VVVAHANLFASAMFCMRWVCWFLLYQWPGANGRLQALNARLGGPRKTNKWRQVGKFAFSHRDASFRIRAQLQKSGKLKENMTLHLEAYREQDWFAAQAMEPCERHKLAHRSLPFELPLGGEWGQWTSATFDEAVPQLWYFATSYCDPSMRKYSHVLNFEFHARQEDGSEFSDESRGSLPWHAVTLVSFAVLVLTCSSLGVNIARRSGSMHPVIWITLTALMSQFSAETFHVLHLARFSYNGVGFKFFEICTNVLSVVSEAVQIWLFLLLGSGYTLLQSKMGELDVLVAVCAVVVLVHLMIVGFGKLRSDGSFRYHDSEGILELLTLLLRAAMFVWFSVVSMATAQASDMQLRSFVQKLRVRGSIYFLLHPCLSVVTLLFDARLQFVLKSFGLMFVQTAANLWLASMVLTRGEYFRVSSLNTSELPGGTRIGVMKEE